MSFYRFEPARGPVILQNLKLRNIFLAWLIFPVFSIVFAFFLSFAIHSEDVVGYNWVCRKVQLPSISRVLNFPLERILWNILSLASLPLHFFVIFRQYSLTASRNIWHQLLRICLVLSAIGQSIFLSMLATVGERESGVAHVVFFCGFAASTLINYTVFNILMRLVYGGKEDPKYSTRRMIILLSLMSIIPIITITFIAHNSFCIPGAYELFAIFEYLTCILIFAYQFSNLYLFSSSQFSQNIAVCYQYGILEKIRI